MAAGRVYRIRCKLSLADWTSRESLITDVRDGRVGWEVQERTGMYNIECYCTVLVVTVLSREDIKQTTLNFCDERTGQRGWWRDDMRFSYSKAAGELE